MSKSLDQSSGDLLELTITAAAMAIRDGSLTAQDYAAALLSRSQTQAHLNSFITLQPEMVLEAAAKADRQRKAGEAIGPAPIVSLRGIRFGVARRQFLEVVDPDVEQAFDETIAKLKAAGVGVVELDLGEDFVKLAERANWPVFFHDTMPHVTEYLKEIGAPVTFTDIFEGLGSNPKNLWRDGVISGSCDFVSESEFRAAMEVDRPALRKRYADAFRANGIEALLFPTTPVAAPPLNTGEEVTIAGRIVSSVKLAKNAFPSSCAALPGITMPMGLSPDGLPMGLEMDGRPGENVKLLTLAAQVSAVLGSIPPPSGM